ncbi:SAM-dependent methyltransferase [Phaeovulum sp. W22_SRMD_FR3]|uniref:SAM-dependent methyltransferase n=1 Tax=Phaeovulum sp. W22_SRMD_FR3 TaxID=3240274 RepID=UPI003F970190
MNTSLPLIDSEALARNRARARAIGPALFLHEEAAEEIAERLADIKRDFTAAAVITAFPEPWLAILPGATIVPEAELLDLTPGAHDLVVHAMGLHWSNDPVGQLVQSRRGLRPDGLFLGVMLGGQTLSELRAVLAEAEVAVSGGLSPRVLPMGEIRDLGGLLQRAGFALPVADASLRRVSYRDALHLMADLRAMGEANALSQRLRHATRRAVIAAAAARYAEAYPEGEGRIRASFELIYLAGWAPHESQQKPLRPGSAVNRLAAALGADETKL